LKICGIAPGLRSLFGGVGSLCLLYDNLSFNFYPIFIPLFESKVSGVRVQDMRLRLPFLTPETKFAEPKRFKKLTPKFIFVNACITKVYKETKKYFAHFSQN
jgi:hypothetical protein